MEKDIRILLVDDHQVVRDGLSTMLSGEPDMEVIGQSAGGEDALNQIAALSPNIVITDIKMPRMDGIQLAFLIKEQFPACNIIMLTLYDEYLMEAMRVGAKGYLLKDITHEELTQAIRRVHRGDTVFGNSIGGESQIKDGQAGSIGSLRADAERTADAPFTSQDSPETMLEDIQLVMPPPVDANQLIRFTKQVERTLHPHIVQVIGSWREGTTVTAILPWATPQSEVFTKLKECAEVDSISEDEWETRPGLFQKASALYGQSTRPKKTIFVHLKNGKATPEPSPSFRG